MAQDLGAVAGGRPAGLLPFVVHDGDDVDEAAAFDRVMHQMRVEPKPEIGPLGRRGPARIDRVQQRPAADAAQEVVEEDRVRLPGVAAPEHDQVGLFRLTI